MDTVYLSPHRQDAGGRKMSDISRSGSEADSLLDLYGHRRSDVGINGGERPAVFAETYPEDGDPESSRWIHRDKLALIESQEMQQAGIKVPRQGRSRSRSNGRRERSHEHGRKLVGTSDIAPLAGKEGKRQRIRSPTPEDVELGESSMDFDLRAPEEISVGNHEETSPPETARQTGLRPGSSRIPLSTSSPAPVPQEHLARNAPLPRKRGASGNWGAGDDDGIAYNKTRNRSYSAGSQILLNGDEMEYGSPAPTTVPIGQDTDPTSLSNLRMVSKAGSLSGARKTPTPSRIVSEPQKSRSTSGTHQTSPSQRPATRSGLSPRPATAINRPEGDPPWLKTMFKPDPMLPPDQQLLPTHAKRLQQEQWEKEGKYGSACDREFEPLAVHTNEGLQAPTPAVGSPEEEERIEKGSAWPLKTLSNASSANGKSRTSGMEHAGYRTVPKVTSPSLTTAPSPKLVQRPSQVQEAPKEKGCGCCVMM